MKTSLVLGIAATLLFGSFANAADVWWNLKCSDRSASGATLTLSGNDQLGFKAIFRESNDIAAGDIDRTVISDNLQCEFPSSDPVQVYCFNRADIQNPKSELRISKQVENYTSAPYHLVILLNRDGVKVPYVNWDFSTGTCHVEHILR